MSVTSEITQLEPGDSPQSAQQFLSLTLLPNIQALLNVQHLTEILSLSLHQIVPIPDVPPAVMGICNWRGEVLWLVDVGYLLGTEPLVSQRDRIASYSVVVITDDHCALGLVVDQVGNMMWYDPSEIYSVTHPPNTLRLSPCLKGCWLTAQGQTCWVLDATALVQTFQTTDEKSEIR